MSSMSLAASPNTPRLPNANANARNMPKSQSSQALSVSEETEIASSSSSLTNETSADDVDTPSNDKTTATADQFTSLLKRPGSFHGRSGLPINKSKSVQWDNKVESGSGPGRNKLSSRGGLSLSSSSGQKHSRQPMLSSPSLKRSTKSFGKPGADIFESSRNATFAEFGNISQSPHMLKTSNGGGARMLNSAYHFSTHMLQRNRISTIPESGGGAKNAQFDLMRPASSSASVPSADFQDQGQQQSTMRKPSFQELSRNAVYSVTPPGASASFLHLQGMASGGSFKRTPTQLETMLMNNTNEGSSRGGGNATFETR
jgi:hypothetical protein